MTKTLFCDKWQFCKNPAETPYESAAGWKDIDIPHDWLIYDVNDLYETSTGWYRRTYIHKNDGLRTSLRFEGVYMDCRVYVNGALAGEWKNGYTTFEFDISALLRDGENLITVRVDHRAPNSRWYSGAGIYRRVWLCRYHETHILPDGVYISASAGGKVYISTETARPAGMSPDELSVHTAILQGEKIIAEDEYFCTAADRRALSPAVVTDGFDYTVNEQRFNIRSPKLWDIESPTLYKCLTELKLGGKVIDSVINTFGFRDAEFTPDKGFFLNGRNIKLHGACEHHDLGALGAAVNKTAIRRKLTKLRKMGVNAIRTTHNPPAAELMELCDEMGFLAVSEFTDVWEIPKTEFDYARFSEQWREKDIAAWVRRDRNCPCVIAWSLGNEIPDTGASYHGQEITSLMYSLVRQHDRRGNGAVTIGSNQMRTENGRKCADIVKTAGYNYSEELYDEHHKLHPDWCIYGSETSSVVTSRGIYHFPLSQSNLGDDDRQCSALGNGSPIWAAKSWEACIIPDRDAPYCAGQFIWTGFDYIGEPTPYDSKNSFFGQFDTAGFPKDGAYVFRGAWTDCKKSPFVHIFPYWDHQPGETVDIRVASNAPMVKLYLDGELIACESFDREHGKKIILDKSIEYRPGTLSAAACDESGKVIAQDIQKSFSDAAYIFGEPDKKMFRADGQDLVFVEITAYDKNMVFCANARNRVNVSVSGAGRLIGLDNGDSTDFEQYKGVSRRLFSGKLLAIIAAKDTPGTVTVTLSSPGLPNHSFELTACEADVTPGISCMEENTGEFITDDLPVRKTELVSDSREFSPERKTIRFTTKFFPAGARPKKIKYRLTTANGIDSSLAVIKEQDDTGVTVECLGDGQFMLRAIADDSVIGSVSLCGTGLGNAFRDPYKLIEAGLYSLSDGEVMNGISHGARIDVPGGVFGIENIDFGSVGSDTVTVPIFADTDKTVSFELYDGFGENAELLGKFDYRKPPEWLRYQPQTYTLPHILRGIHTISVKAQTKIDFGGLEFTERVKEQVEIFACEYENIYGDSFKVCEKAVTGIGNNVILDFGEFDFTQRSPEKIFIKGKSQLPLNSIQILLSDGTDKRFICGFAGSDDYTERAFPLQGVSGRVKLSFIFLPGCDFDLLSFRFGYTS